MLKTSTCRYLQVVIQLHVRNNEAAVKNALGWLKKEGYVNKGGAADQWLSATYTL